MFSTGQLYKVNVPVVVTQAPAGQQPASHPTQRLHEWREAPTSQPALVPPNPILPREPEPSSVLASSITHPRTTLPLSQGSGLPRPELTPGDNEQGPPPEPVNVSPCTQLLDFQISKEEALARTAQSRDIDDILKEVIEGEREKVERARNQAAGNTSGQPEADLEVNLKISFPSLY